MATESQRGRAARRPRELGSKGWKDVLSRVRGQVKSDNLALVAAGVAFFAFLGIFPALAALVSLYGLVADPADVERQVSALGGALPSGARDLLMEQMRRVAQTSGGALSWGFGLSLLLTLWSARKGMDALIKGMNIAYDQEEGRGFIKRNALALTLTLGAIVGVIVAVFLIVAIPPLLGNLGLGGAARTAVDLLRWPLLALLLLLALAVLYRFAPNRHHAQWRWVTPGSLVAMLLWLGVSILFSIYVASFGNFNETYGSLGAVVILLLWLYLSALVILLGAELNSEAEHQTRRDSTTGEPRPMGERGAHHADTLGPSPSKG